MSGHDRLMSLALGALDIVAFESQPPAAGLQILKALHARHKSQMAPTHSERILSLCVEQLLLTPGSERRKMMLGLAASEVLSGAGGYCTDKLAEAGRAVRDDFDSVRSCFGGKGARA